MSACAGVTWPSARVAVGSAIDPQSEPVGRRRTERGHPRAEFSGPDRGRVSDELVVQERGQFELAPVRRGEVCGEW